MSEKDSGMIIHPEILSLIRKRDEIHRLLYADYTPISAMEQMIGLLNELRQEHKGEGLSETLKKTYLGITTLHSRTRRIQRGKALKWKLWGYLDNLNGLLWKHGYLTNEFYRQAIPSAGLNVSGAKPKKGIPSTMSSRVSQ